MLFEGEKLDEYIEQIVQEQKEEEKMRTIVLNHFNNKPMSEVIKIVNTKDYGILIDQLKPIRQYYYENDYHYDIEYFLFKHFTEDAVEIQLLDVVPEEIMSNEFFDIYILEENNQTYLLTSNMGQGQKIHSFQKFKIKTKEMRLTYDYSKELKQLKEKYNKKLKGHFMLELLHSLQNKLNKNYEKIAKTTNSSVYFEREKANNVKEIFRINFIDDNIKYYNIHHQTTLDDIKELEPTDSIPFANNQEILDYIYGA